MGFIIEEADAEYFAKKEENIEKEHRAEMRKLKSMVKCDCGYKAIGKNLREQLNDMHHHVIQQHPERRKFKL